MRTPTYCLLATPLVPSGIGPVRVDTAGRRHTVFLAQGDLDGACGFYCVGMALLALGVIKRAQFTYHHRNTKAVKTFLEAMQRQLFEGTDVDELITLISNLPLPVKADALLLPRRHLIAVMSEALRDGHLLVAGVEGQGGRLNHWVLIVGMEVNRRRRPSTTSAFLVLDASEPRPTVCCWNARLEVSDRLCVLHRLRGTKGRAIAVRIDGVVAIKANTR